MSLQEADTIEQRLYHIESGTLVDLDPNRVDVRCRPDLPPELEVAAVEVIVRVRPRG